MMQTENSIEWKCAARRKNIIAKSPEERYVHTYFAQNDFSTCFIGWPSSPRTTSTSLMIGRDLHIPHHLITLFHKQFIHQHEVKFKIPILYPQCSHSLFYCPYLTACSAPFKTKDESKIHFFGCIQKESNLTFRSVLENTSTRESGLKF
jgi:hypothetical protein